MHLPLKCVGEWGFPGVSVIENLPASAVGAVSISGQKIPLEKEMATHFGNCHFAVFLSRKSHGQRSLAGYSPCGHKRVTLD